MATSPGDYAVPGAMWPGFIWPGAVIPGAVATHLFGGTETLVYPDYIDLAAGHTLVASPGGKYRIAPAGQGVDYGFTVPPPDGQWEF